MKSNSCSRFHQLVKRGSRRGFGVRVPASHTCQIQENANVACPTCYLGQIRGKRLDIGALDGGGGGGANVACRF